MAARIKTSISSPSKPPTRTFNCFVLEHSVFQTKHLRHLLRDFERGFEDLEILGVRVKLEIGHRISFIMQTNKL